MKTLLKWLSTPTSKAGMTAVLSAIVGAVSGVTTWLHAVPLVAFGVAMIALPDDTVAQKDIEELVTDAVNTSVAVRAAAIAPSIAVPKAIAPSIAVAETKPAV